MAGKENFQVPKLISNNIRTNFKRALTNVRNKNTVMFANYRTTTEGVMHGVTLRHASVIVAIM